MILTKDILINKMHAEPRSQRELNKISSAMIDTFSTPSGRITLQAIMMVLGEFREAENDEDRVLQNAAKKIRYLMGAGNEMDHVDAWLKIAGKAALTKAAKGAK